MGYRMTYLRIRCGYCSGWQNDAQNNVANRYASELIEQLVQSGQLIAAVTDYGIGLRTATEKELKDNHQATEQIDGQMTMTFYLELSEVKERAIMPPFPLFLSPNDHTSISMLERRTS